MDQTEKTEQSKIKSLRTYRGDVEEAMLQNKTGASSIFIAEQERKNRTYIEPTDESTGFVSRAVRNKIFIILGCVIFLLGIIVVSAVYYLKSNEKVVIEKTTKALITFSTEKSLPIKGLEREQAVSSILQEKKSFNLPVNSVLYINITSPTGAVADLEDVLQLIAPRMPPALARSFESKYMIGVYSFDTNELFIILTTNDFAGSFAGMQKWEKDISYDFAKLFTIPQNIATTTNTFSDEASRNKDLRVLKDFTGKTVLLYSFIDKNTLVITTNENVLTAIISKYLISKKNK